MNASTHQRLTEGFSGRRRRLSQITLSKDVELKIDGDVPDASGKPERHHPSGQVPARDAGLCRKVPCNLLNLVIKCIECCVRGRLLDCLLCPPLSLTMPSSPAHRYTTTTIALHWVLAAALLGLLVFGWYMVGLPFSPAKLQVLQLAQVGRRDHPAAERAALVWRLACPPALPARMAAAMPRWQHLAHHGVHHLLYALFFAVPLIGWAYSSAAGFHRLVRPVAVARLRARQPRPGRGHQALAHAGRPTPCWPWRPCTSPPRSSTR